MKRQIVYVMSYPAHLPYLVVSLWTLRKHYDGEIVVYAWSESYDIVKRIAEDERLQIEVIPYDPKHKGRNAQFECKQQVMMAIDADVGLYLDADTMICGNLDSLFENGEEYGFVATQYCGRYACDWQQFRERFELLKKYTEIDQRLVESILVNKWPTVNGGVFACKPSSPILPLWHEWTKVAREIYIADEVVLHTMLPKFGSSKEITVMMERGIYNCSTRTYLHPYKLRDDKIVIWHLHGNTNVRVDKSPKGFGLWWPVFCDTVKENVGGVAEWYKKVKNNYLTKLRKRIEI